MYKNLFVQESTHFFLDICSALLAIVQLDEINI